MILFTMLGIPISLLGALIFFNRQLPLVAARKYWAPIILWISGVKITIIGSENIDHEKPSIFVSNHMSFLDIPCLFYALPKNLHFIAKESLKKIPFLGWFMMATGMIFVDRSNQKKSIASLKQAALLINKEKNVLVFPEGSRSDDGQVKSFKKGAFHLAMQSGATLIPVGIKGTRNVWPKDSFKLTPGKVVVKIGPGIDTSTMNDTSAADLSKLIRKDIISFIQ